MSSLQVVQQATDDLLSYSIRGYSTRDNVLLNDCRYHADAYYHWVQALSSRGVRCNPLGRRECDGGKVIPVVVCSMQWVVSVLNTELQKVQTLTI